jgi:hypothetical protein
MYSRTRLVILALALAFSAVACKAQVRATATVSEPSLVLVDGDVWVVEHYNEPVFYTEGYYWRWYGGVWYRSTVHTGNWVQVTVVPAHVQRIERPEIYVNYTAPAGVQKRTGPPDHAPAHGVRGTEPGHADDRGPPDHAPGHGGPPMDKPAKEEKAAPPDKEEKAMKPAKEEKAMPAKEEKASKPAKEEKPSPPKEEKPAKSGGEEKPKKK